MLTNFLLFITLLAYSSLVSQSIMYVIALKNVQTSMEAVSYIEIRKLLDVNFRRKFKYVVYTSLISNLLLVIVTAPSGILFLASLISFACLILDIVFMKKGNMPINDLVNEWSADNYPANWKDYRSKWFQYFTYRQFANLAGFISLLIGAISR